MIYLATAARLTIHTIAAFAIMFVALSPTNGEPTIKSRADWKAAKAIDPRKPKIKVGKFEKKEVYAENKMPKSTFPKPPKYLTVHHTAGPVRNGLMTEEKLRRMQKFMTNGDYWIGNKQIYLGDMAYHYFIAANGDTGEGRERRYAPFSNTTYRSPIEEHLTVVLEGNFEDHEPTPAQLSSLTEVLYTLARQHKIPLNYVGYHQQVASTTCPGHHMIARMPGIIEALRQRGIACVEPCPH